MNPVNDFLLDPDPSLGGAIIPIVGMPGSGKTIGLTQIGLENLDSGNTVLWRGTKQCQWIHFLANDTPVTLWNHSAITDMDAYITAGSTGEQPEQVTLSDKDIRIETWGNASDLITNLDEGRVNVVNIPGLEDQDQNNMYFFRQQWLEIFDALIERRTGNMICFLFDEIGDVIPSQQQLRKPFYKLIAEFLPPKLSQLRKQRVLLYGAAHATHDTHYFFWKIKANSLVYMSNAVVKKAVTPNVDQDAVNSLDRGEFIFPPKTDPSYFKEPRLAEDLDWIPNRESAYLNVDWTADIPDVLGVEGGGDSMTKAEIGHALWEAGLGTQKEIAEALDLTQAAISEAG